MSGRIHASCASLRGLTYQRLADYAASVGSKSAALLDEWLKEYAPFTDKLPREHNEPTRPPRPVPQPMRFELVEDEYPADPVDPVERTPAPKQKPRFQPTTTVKTITKPPVTGGGYTEF